MSENEIDFKRLAQHIGTDSETGLESCNFCLKIFHGKHLSTRRRSLMNHIDLVHLKVISHKCQFCDKSLKGMQNKASIKKFGFHPKLGPKISEFDIQNLCT